jgi:hypothetical protein
VNNNPVNAIDPTGHQCVGEPGECLEDDGTAGSGFTGTGGTVSNPGAGDCSGSGCHGIDGTPEEEPEAPTTSCTITSCDPLEVLQSVNYQLAPLNPVTLYNWYVFAGVMPIGDLQIEWLPNLTFNNGSQVTLTPTTVIYGPAPAPFAPRFALSGIGPTIGYIDSPIFKSSALSGLNIPFPKMGRFTISAIATLRTQRISYTSRVNVTYTTRPDYAGTALAPVALGSFLLLQAQKASMGIPFCPNGVTC